MTELINDNLLKALQKEPVPYTPIWLMRQAGRFLPEYRATREKAGSFLNLAHSPEYATEVTLQPVDRFDLDAAILFSDILTVPDAMGLGLKFVPGEGPVFESPVQSEEAVVKLHVPDVGTDLKYVTDAVSSIRSALQGRVPLFGFSGSPFTLACYMIEGRGSRNFFTVKSMMYRRPDLFQKVISVNEKAVTEYLNAQIEAGAQAIQIFDTWGGCLADGLYQQYSLASIRNVIANLTREHEGRRVPVVVFTKGGSVWLKDIASCGADAVGLDWMMNLARARLIRPCFSLMRRRCAKRLVSCSMPMVLSARAVMSSIWATVLISIHRWNSSMHSLTKCITTAVSITSENDDRFGAVRKSHC